MTIDQELDDLVMMTRYEFALDLDKAYKDGLATGGYHTKWLLRKHFAAGLLLGAIGTLAMVLLAWILSR